MPLLVVLSERRSIQMVVLIWTEGPTDGTTELRCTPTCRRSVRSSVISVRAQLREYSRPTRQADGEHCLRLVWIGLEARLLLWFSGRPTLATARRWSFLLCSVHTAAGNGTRKHGWPVRGRRQRSGAPDLRFSGMFVRGVQAVQTQG